MCSVSRDDGRTAIDRNVWQYLVTASSGTYDPARDGNAKLRAERVAAFQLPVYGVKLWLPPMAQLEMDRIQDPKQRRANEGMREVFLQEIGSVDEAVVTARTEALLEHHYDPDDCRAIAEAELAGMARFLTFDEDLVKNLSGHTPMRLMYPSDYLKELNIPPGSEPCWETGPVESDFISGMVAPIGSFPN